MITILLTKEVELKWCSKTKNHYISLGYSYTKRGEPFIAKIEDVTHGSTVPVQVKCDYCGKVYTTQYSTVHI